MSGTPLQIAEVQVLPVLIQYVESNTTNPANIAGNTAILIGQLQNLGIPVAMAELSALGGNLVSALQAKLAAAQAAIAAPAAAP